MPNYGNEIASISLGSIIGGALNAIVEAQSQAANTTVEFIKSVGFTTDKTTGVMEPVYVDFQYAKGQMENEKGEKTQTVSNLKVPVLSMVPIPFIRVDDATIDFNVKINSVEETKSSKDTTAGGSTEAHAGYNGWRFKTGIKLNASFSNQKKSSMSDTVKKDYSLNVHVHAVQDDMPAGVERLLGILEDSIIQVTEEGKKQTEKDKTEVAEES